MQSADKEHISGSFNISFSSLFRKEWVIKFLEGHSGWNRLLVWGEILVRVKYNKKKIAEALKIARDLLERFENAVYGNRVLPFMGNLGHD